MLYRVNIAGIIMDQQTPHLKHVELTGLQYKLMREVTPGLFILMIHLAMKTAVQ